VAERYITESVESELLTAALRGMRSAKVLWGFRVGAAVLADDERIYEGCNVESEIAGLGVCAERSAIDHAVIHGNRKIRAVAVVADHPSIESLTPCGACRQYIKEFADGDIYVVMAMAKSESIQKSTKLKRKISELFPYPYRTNAFSTQTTLPDIVQK
jgi:cytidine deaminase